MIHELGPKQVSGSRGMTLSLSLLTIIGMNRLPVSASGRRYTEIERQGLSPLRNGRAGH